MPWGITLEWQLAPENLHREAVGMAVRPGAKAFCARWSIAPDRLAKRRNVGDWHQPPCLAVDDGVDVTADACCLLSRCVSKG